jgi:hypothetical protein
MGMAQAVQPKEKREKKEGRKEGRQTGKEGGRKGKKCVRESMTTK